MAKFCTQCGFQNADEVFFCSKCGQKAGEVLLSSTSSGESDSSLAVISVAVSIFIPIIFPFIMWLTQRNQNKHVEDTAKEVLNFQLTYVVGLIVLMIGLGILSFVGAMLSHGIGAFFGVMLMGLVNFSMGVAYLVFMIIAAIKVSKNESYRFPFTVRLIR
jgi:uncharacterized Tic20 family protein